MRRIHGYTLIVTLIVAAALVSCRAKPTPAVTGTLRAEKTESAPTLTVAPAAKLPPGQKPAAQTTTPQGTVTGTPVAPLIMNSCPFSVICPQITDIQRLVHEQVIAGKIYKVDIAYDSPLRIGAEWMTFQPGAAGIDLSALRFFFEIDGQDYASPADVSVLMLPDPKTPSLTRPAAGIGYVLQGWQLGKPRTVMVGYEFLEKVVDAGVVNKPGTKVIYTYIINPVSPADAKPANTPTASQTSPPGIKPTNTSTIKPTNTLAINPTNTPAAAPTTTATIACVLDTVITVRNTTNADVTITFTGPARFSFTLAPGVHVLKLCTGQYDYKATGCNGSTVTGTAVNGDEIEFWCD